MLPKEPEDFCKFLIALLAQGDQEFKAPSAPDAFEAWWQREYGNKMRGSKYLARKAFYAGLREMGCFAGKERK